MARIAFAGSPGFAKKILSRLHTSEHDVVLVISRPNRPSGRSGSMTAPEAAAYATSNGLRLIQPPHISETLSHLKESKAEVLIVAAYGHILPPEVLDVCPHGAINVHASILPAYRGASPVQQAILDGLDETGVTIMKMDEGLDTGPIISKHSVPVQQDDTTGTLTERLAETGARLLLETLPKYLSGEIQPEPQPTTQAKATTRLKKKDGQIDWTKPASYIERHVRAMLPWPVAFTYANGEPVQILQGEVSDGPVTTPGRFDKRPPLMVDTGEGRLRINRIRPAGRAVMDGEAYLRGYRGSYSFESSGG